MSSATPPPGTKTGTGRRAPFPHHYEIELSGAGPGVTIGAGPRPVIEGGAPDSFGGREDWWSPEHLLLASLGLCLKTTFDAFAAKERVEVRAYASRTHGVLDKASTGLAFTSLVIEVDLDVAAADVERARNVVETAKHWCIVSDALKPPVEVRLTVKGG